MIGGITHTAHLPLGYVAEFRWTGGGMKVEWLPNVPVIRSPRHPERGTGGELIQQRQGRTGIAFRSLIKTRNRRAQQPAAPHRSSGVASLAVAGWEADRQPTV